MKRLLSILLALLLLLPMGISVFADEPTNELQDIEDADGELMGLPEDGGMVTAEVSPDEQTDEKEGNGPEPDAAIRLDVSTDDGTEKESDIYIWILLSIAVAVIIAGVIVRFREKKVKIQRLDRQEETE